MSLMAGLKGRKAYMAHAQGNRLLDAGQHALARQKHEEALKLYEEALNAGCDVPKYYMGYGILLLRERQFERAREIFLKADKLPKISKEDKHQLRLNYGICQWKLGNLDKAIDLMKSVAQNGKNGTIYGSLGFMLIQKAEQTGDYAEAIAFNEEALDYDDEDAVVLDNMGQLYYRMGDHAKAMGYFKRAHEIKPKQVDTLYYLSKLYQENGDEQTARKLIDRALAGNFTALCTVTREQAKAQRETLGPLPAEDSGDEDGDEDD